MMDKIPADPLLTPRHRKTGVELLRAVRRLYNNTPPKTEGTMNWDTIAWIALFTLGAALIGGGLVLYMQTRRAGWRALGMSFVAGGVAALLVVALIVPASESGEAPEPVIVKGTVPAQSSQPQTTEQQPGGSVYGGMMVPRPRSAEEIVTRAHVIVLGTVAAVLSERWIGPYGEDGQSLPADEDGMPVTDYEVQVESVLKGDGTVIDGSTLVLRMFGHLSNPNAIITSNVFTLPNPGDHLLLALGTNPDGTYGSGPEGLLDVDSEKVAYIDGVPFATETSPEQLMEDIRDAVSPPCCKKVAEGGTEVQVFVSDEAPPPVNEPPRAELPVAELNVELAAEQGMPLRP